MSLVINLKDCICGRQRSRDPRYIFGATAIFVVCAVVVPALRTTRETKSAKVTSFFLVASPNLSDPFFRQSVILMLPPAPIPLVGGIIINKPTTIPLPKSFSGAPALKNQATVYFGGPVEITEPSLILRGVGLTGNVTRLFDDVYVSTDRSSVAKFVRDPRLAESQRLFFGRAQWTQRQLHAEILVGAWYVVPAEADLVFSPDPGRIWHVLVERARIHEVDVTASRSEVPLYSFTALADRRGPFLDDCGLDLCIEPAGEAFSDAAPIWVSVHASVHPSASSGSRGRGGWRHRELDHSLYSSPQGHRTGTSQRVESTSAPNVR
jgi:putative transcriptional regulator